MQISNNKGELYSLSIRNPNFKWIQDLSSFDSKYILTPANNGILYVTLPTQALLLALDVYTGNILWQGRTGPLSSEDYAPAVQSNGNEMVLFIKEKCLSEGDICILYKHTGLLTMLSILYLSRLDIHWVTRWFSIFIFTIRGSQEIPQSCWSEICHPS